MQKKNYKFSVSAYQWIQLCVCLFEVERSCSIDDLECEI